MLERSIIILNALISEDTAAEIPVTLTDADRRALHRASKAILRLNISAVSGSPEITINSLQCSYDGTTFRDHTTINLPVTADAELAAPQITLPLIDVKKLRLDITATVLDPSNNFVLKAEILMIS